MSLPTRVLSIQSWVVHGYVGNKCSTVALQTLGIEVDPMNTVQFSNHTGYPTFRGTVTTADELWNIWLGLNESGVAQYTHLLTGYCRNVDALKKVAAIADTIKERYKDFVYVCDPVMGDDGKLYVSVTQEVVETYKTEILKRASVLLPNMTELEALTDMKITTLSEAEKAIDCIHQKGVPVVIAKSIVLPSLPQKMNVIISSIDGGVTTRHMLSVDRIPGVYSGNGDLFASLILGWTSKGFKPHVACEKTCVTIEALLRRTHESGQSELRLLECIGEIASPAEVKEGDSRKAVLLSQK
eukprot:TRINITY_DN20048_c0_g1_i1.p1 TRINITY_DN20048_c0_g1~~TRINITY_DN20048_c0_g1_i1.p1  ORF type:complete len:298 (+),score=74.24 TRINITY_DN20048_c0_g1_i1:36-929(+)